MGVGRVINHVNFYPRSPCGERLCSGMSVASNFYFYPRSPCGERRIGLVFLWWGVRISIHALLAESDSYKHRIHHKEKISIHALLAESDGKPKALKSRLCVFLSTLSLRRATNRYGRPIDVQFVFLSTLSLRRATICQERQAEFFEHFYPRSPCGERRGCFTRCRF